MNTSNNIFNDKNQPNSIEELTILERTRNILRLVISYLRKANNFIVLFLFALLIIIANCYAIMSRQPFLWEPSLSSQLSRLYTLNISFIFLISINVFYQLFLLFSHLRQSKIGSKLRKRILKLTMLVITGHAVFFTIFAFIFSYVGFDSWVSGIVDNTIRNTNTITSEYESEYRSNINKGANGLKEFASNNAQNILNDPISFEAEFRKQTEALSLDSARLFFFNKTGNVVHILFKTEGISVENNIDRRLIESVSDSPFIMINHDNLLITAYVKVTAIDNLYLEVANQLSAELNKRIVDTQKSSQQYQQVKSQIQLFRDRVLTIFVMSLLILVLITYISSYRLADKFITPIANAIGKHLSETINSNSIKMYDRYKTLAEVDEIYLIVHSLNRIKQMERDVYSNSPPIADNEEVNIELANKSEPVAAESTQPKEPSLIEQILYKVFGSIKTSLIVLDEDFNIKLFNRYTTQLIQEIGLKFSAKEITDHHIKEILPELSPLLQKLEQSKEDAYISEVIEFSSTQENKSFLATIIKETIFEESTNYIINLADITKTTTILKQENMEYLISSLFNKANYNPFKPLYLAISRLENYFLDNDEDNASSKSSLSPAELNTEKIETYLNMLKSNIKYIENIVSVFYDYTNQSDSAYLQPQNLYKIIGNIVKQKQLAHPSIHFNIQKVLQLDDFIIECNYSQIYESLEQIISNAVEAIYQKVDQITERKSKSSYRGEVIIYFINIPSHIVIRVQDNGVGLPKDISNLISPMFTTKSDRFGIGLALADKFIKFHNGKITFDRTNSGAIVNICFPANGKIANNKYNFINPNT